jgi:hypothetical protein
VIFYAWSKKCWELHSEKSFLRIQGSLSQKRNYPPPTDPNFHYSSKYVAILVLMGREILYSENKQSWKLEFTVLRQQIEWI